MHKHRSNKIHFWFSSVKYGRSTCAFCQVKEKEECLPKLDRLLEKHIQELFLMQLWCTDVKSFTSEHWKCFQGVRLMGSLSSSIFSKSWLRGMGVRVWHMWLQSLKNASRKVRIIEMLFEECRWDSTSMHKLHPQHHYTHICRTLSAWITRLLLAKMFEWMSNNWA